MRTGPRLVAHRGMPRHARENTIASFALALDARADGIELDVHATRDGVVVVHHDDTLTSGQSIAELSHSELLEATRDVVDVPTLADVTRLIAGQAELFVELKGRAIEDAVIQSLTGYLGAVALHSFDHAMIARVARKAPAMRLGILVEEEPSDVRGVLRETGARDLWPQHECVTTRMVHEAHESGARVIAWTVNNARDAATLATMGVDGLCTDDVSALAEILRPA